MKARVTVTLKTGILDPQGKAIEGALKSLGVEGVASVRQGKVFDIEISGADKAKAEAEKRVTESAALPLATAAPRAAYLARTDGGATAYDLIKGIKDGKVKLEELKKEELPKELVGKNLTEQKQILEKLDKEREVLSKRALELEKMRNEFIAKKIAEDTKLATPTSFENEVLGILRVQAGRRSGIAYDVAEPKKK